MEKNIFMIAILLIIFSFNVKACALCMPDEDEHIPIIIKVVNALNNPLPGCTITLSNGNYTLPSTTDEFGVDSTTVRYFGQWHLTIIYQDYVPVDTDLNIIDSNTVLTFTLQHQ